MFPIKICDIHFSTQCFKLCGNYGLDVISTAYLTGFAIDLYQRGILTQQDTGGLVLKWQDRNVAFRMIEKIVPFVSYDIDKNSLADCTGICVFWTGFWQYNPILVEDHLRLIEYAAGIAMDEEKAMDAAKRSELMTRAFNVMTGISRKDDTIHQRFFESPSDGETPIIDRDRFNEMISRFYKLRAWNYNWIPSAKELDRLGLQVTVALQLVSTDP